MLLWPLFTGVCLAPYLDERMRLWAIGRMQYMDSSLGIRKAGLMAAALLGTPLGDEVVSVLDVFGAPLRDYYRGYLGTEYTYSL